MFRINYDKILVDKETPAFVKDLVRSIQSKGMIHPGHWIQNLSTTDLLAIGYSIKQVKKGPPPMDPSDDRPGDLPIQVGGVFIFLVDILSSAESLDIVHEGQVFKTRASLLESYINMELMKRRGFDVKVFYSNMSLNEEEGTEESKLPIFEEGPEFKNQLVDSLMRRFEQTDSKLRENMVGEKEEAKEKRRALIKELGRSLKEGAGDPEEEISSKRSDLIVDKNQKPEIKRARGLVDRAAGWLENFRKSKGSGEHEV